MQNDKCQEENSNEVENSVVGEFLLSNSFTDEKSFDYIKELYRNTLKKNSGRADSKEVLRQACV